MKNYTCEQCGKEHDGSYGSGRFCSKTCRAKFIASKVKHHVCNFNSKPHSKGNWKCKHCENVFETRKLLIEHNKQLHPQFCNGGGWNRGLTKETNEIVKKRGETLSNNLKSGKTKNVWVGRHHSEETKKKISEIMKQKLANGEIITPYIRNHHSKGPSYPEQYFMDVFKNANINVEYDYHVGLYQLDFANPKTKRYVEIDGDQHYFDKRIVDHDIKRTENLSEKGWVLITRIKWSEFQKLSLSEREKICNLIIQQLR